MVPGWSEAMNDEKKPPVVSGAVQIKIAWSYCTTVKLSAIVRP